MNLSKYEIRPANEYMPQGYHEDVAAVCMDEMYIFMQSVKNTRDIDTYSLPLYALDKYMEWGNK